MLNLEIILINDGSTDMSAYICQKYSKLYENVIHIDKKNGDYLFKMGFGGKVYESIGSYDLIINKWLYKIIKLINVIKK